MLLEKETQEECGYLPSSLSKKSSKKICVECDYCGEKYDLTPKRRLTGHKVIKKDSCMKCGFKKREEISLAKYGVKNPSQREEVRAKLTKVDWKKEKEKVIQMYEEGFSLAHIANTFKTSHNSVCVRLTEWGIKVDKNKKSRHKTMEDIYGEGYQEKIDKKREDTCMERFGVDNAFKSEEKKKKIRESTLKNHGVTHLMKDPERAKKAVRKGVETRMKKGDIFVYGGKTLPEIAEEQGFSHSHFHGLVKKHGIEKALTLDPYQSSLETTMEDWLISEGIEHEKQFRVGGKIADFKIGDILTEVNGNYWHSQACPNAKSRNYHMEKRQLYIDNGYTPLFFMEDEINNKFSIVQSILLNKLGKSQRVFARKCKRGTVSKEEGRKFVEENHLMGSIKKGTFFGLYHEGELISIMSIYRKKGDLYEISRMCHKKRTTVIGGFSKLLKFAQSFLPEMRSLMTFIDLRYGQGDYLVPMGFVEKKTYLSFKWTDGKNTFHRMKFPASTGYEKGLFKIYDCGQRKLILDF